VNLTRIAACLCLALTATAAPLAPAHAQSNVNAIYDRAVRSANAGGITRAIALFKEVLEVDPFWSSAYFEIGALTQLMDRHDECVLYSTRFLSLEPDSPDRPEVEQRVEDCAAAIADAGTLQIVETSPDRALITVAGVSFGRGATGPITLSPGEYTVTATAIDHEPYTTQVTVAAGEPTRVQLNLVPFIFQGELMVVSEVEGAEVYVDGAFIGATPLASPIERNTGTYYVEVRAEGYHPWRRNAVIEREDTTVVDVRLIDDEVDLSAFY
jgi:hypothetical protein